MESMCWISTSTWVNNYYFHIISWLFFFSPAELAPLLGCDGRGKPMNTKYILLYFLKDPLVLVADQEETSQPRQYLLCDAGKSRVHC